MTSSGGKLSTSSKSYHWQARTYKWCTRVRWQARTHWWLKSRARLKSPANQGIAESEWHEPIHNILRKAIQRHTPCHEGLGSCNQVLASHLHHLSWFQYAWSGQRHASKQRTSFYSMVQVSSSRGNRLWWHVDATWLQSHATELTDISPKDEKYPQDRTTEPLKIQSQPPEGQSKSKHKSLDSGRGTPKAMGSHTRGSAEEERGKTAWLS